MLQVVDSNNDYILTVLWMCLHWYQLCDWPPDGEVYFHKLPALIYWNSFPHHFDDSCNWHETENEKKKKPSPSVIPDWDFEVLQFLLKQQLTFKIDAVLYKICFFLFTDRTIIAVWGTADVRYDLCRAKHLESVTHQPRCPIIPQKWGKSS